MAKSQQQIMPTATIAPVQQMPPAEKAMEYLRQAGWTQASVNERGDTFWSDPAGNGPRAGKQQQTVSLPGKDGNDPVLVSQTVCPPAQWDYPLVEALNIQRQRDRAEQENVEKAVA